MEPKIFLSHRHADENIASVIRQHVESWTTPRKVFQSSAPNRGIAPGEHLTAGLRQALSDTNLLVLVYTSSTEDWSYVMWEAGLATDPSTENTRVVVFKCGNDSPSVYQDYVSVDVTQESIRDFVTRFHTQMDFFPPPKIDKFQTQLETKSTATQTSDVTVNTAFMPNIGTDVLEHRSDQLYSALKEVIPGGREDDAHLLDFLRLRLNYDDRQIIENDNKSTNHLKTLRQHLHVIKPRVRYGIDRSVNPSVRQFGFQQYKEGLTLEALIQSWNEEYNSAKESGTFMGVEDWSDTLCHHLLSAIKNKPFDSIAPPFRSVRHNVNWWFRAIVTRQREFANGGLEFDVYLVPAESLEGPESG